MKISDNLGIASVDLVEPIGPTVDSQTDQYMMTYQSAKTAPSPTCWLDCRIEPGYNYDAETSYERP